MKLLFLSDCLGLKKPDRNYYVNAGDINPSTGKAYAINPGSGNWDDNYFAKNYGNTGSANVDLNAPTNQATQNMSDLKSLFATQNGETSDFLNRYTGAINGQETSSAMAKRIGTELGIPTLQANANQINTTLANLPSTYSKATTGYDVNANQLARIIGQKTSELTPAATTANNALSSAQGTLNTQMGYETADQQKALLPYQTEGTMLSDRLARETTGYTSAMQSELEATIAKMNAGVTVSQGELDRANQLAIAEKSYQAQLAQIQGQKDVATIQNDRYRSIGAGGIYDPITGQVIQGIKSAGNGSTASGSGGNPLSGGFDYSKFGL